MKEEENKQAIGDARKARQAEAHEVYRMAVKIKKFPMGGWFRLKGFASRVINMIQDYWRLQDDHRACELIFANSGSPLGSAAEDYKEVRRMQGVLGGIIIEERAAHDLTKGLLSGRNKSVAELNEKVEDLTGQLKRSNDMYLDTEKMLNEKLQALEIAKRDIRSLQGDLAREKRCSEDGARAIAAIEYRSKEIEAILEEQKELNIKMADRCAGQHEIIAANAAKKQS